MKKNKKTSVAITFLVLALSLGMMLGLYGCPPKPPEDPNTEPVVLFLPNSNADGFKVKAALCDGSAGHIVSLLVDEGALPQGCALNSFTLTGANSAALDMNAEFGQALTNTGTTGEYLYAGSLINTLLVFFEIDEITLTVEGEILVTGHIIYDQPLTFYENY
ncbi:MAG: GerMN domain-containing protein [Coriobacteriia bacterium]|nr:GerMN domain-containing protein [Coriobacteriia bacterium]